MTNCLFPIFFFCLVFGLFLTYVRSETTLDIIEAYVLSDICFYTLNLGITLFGYNLYKMTIVPLLLCISAVFTTSTFMCCKCFKPDGDVEQQTNMSGPRDVTSFDTEVTLDEEDRLQSSAQLRH